MKASLALSGGCSLIQKEGSHRNVWDHSGQWSRKEKREPKEDMKSQGIQYPESEKEVCGQAWKKQSSQ